MQTKRRTRRWVLWVVPAFAALLLALYAYLTHPARLQTRAVAALEALGMTGVQIGHVAFRPPGTLLITDLSGPDLPQADRAPNADTAPRWHISSARVTCQPLELLRGRVRPRAIDVGHASLQLVFAAVDDRRDLFPEALETDVGDIWRMLARTDLPPRLAVSQADVQLMVAAHGQPQLFERMLIRVKGNPTAAGYALRIEPFPTSLRPLAELSWRRDPQQLEATLDWMRLGTVKRLLPPKLVAQLEGMGVTGRVRLERLVLEPGVAPVRVEMAPGARPLARMVEATLLATELRGGVPVEKPVDGEAPDPAEVFLRVRDAEAEIRYRCDDEAASGRMDVLANGRLNDGSVALMLSGDGDLLRRLAGLSAGERSGARGILDHVREAELRLSDIQLPTLTEQPAFVHSQRLPGPVRAAFRDYDPRGKVNLTVEVLPPTSGAASRIVGTIEALGGACRYWRFPYPFEDATGHVRFEGGRVLMDGLCARHGSARVCVEGALNSTSEWTGFDLVFRGRNVPLSEDLYAALPPEYQRLWQDTTPIGLCDVTTRIHRADGTPESGPLAPVVEVEGEMLAGSLALGGSDRLASADGRFAVRDGVVYVHDLHGHAGEARIRQSGRIWMSADGPQADVRVAVADLLIVERAVFPGSTAEAPQEALFEGRADAWGRVHGVGSGADRAQHLALHVKDGRLNTLDARHRWTQADGWVILRDDQRRLESFECRQGDAVFRAAGVLSGPDSATAPMVLDLRAEGAEVSSLVGQFVPRPWDAFAEAFGLGGTGDVEVNVRPAGVETAGRQALDVRLQADRMRADPMPLALRDVEAEFTLEPGRFALRSARALWGETGEVRMEGDGSWEGDNVDVNLNVHAERMVFSPALNEGLPKPLAELLEKLAAQGSFDAILYKVQLRGGSERRWLLQGHVPLRDANLRLGLALTGLEAELSGTCVVEPDGEVGLDAEFNIARGAVAGRPIESWRGVLLRKPGERWLRLEDMRGRLCEGEAIGSVWIDPNTAEYELSLTLKRVRIDQLMPPADSDDGKSGPSGWLDGKVHVRGRGSDITTRRGGGDLRLLGASFLKTPVLSSVSQAGPDAQRQIDDRVEQADIRFLWEGSRIRLQRVDIQSQDLRLIGEGRWDMADDSLSMTLVGAHPESLPRILMISDLLETAGKELVQYRVEGTRRAPVVTAEPLYKLNETLRALLQGTE
jgi:hypothetical protein